MEPSSSKITSNEKLPKHSRSTKIGIKLADAQKTKLGDSTTEDLSSLSQKAQTIDHLSQKTQSKGPILTGCQQS